VGQVGGVERIVVVVRIVGNNCDTHGYQGQDANRLGSEAVEGFWRRGLKKLSRGLSAAPHLARLGLSVSLSSGMRWVASGSQRPGPS